MDSEVKNLYVHIPFCDGKCSYCAFYSVVSRHEDILRYASLPAKEAALLGFSGLKPETAYFGGGTPGLLGKDGFEIAVKSFADRGINLSEAKEWTVELNPASVTFELMQTLRASGVTRISIGVQSFCDDTLRRIGRRHSSEEALKAVSIARKAGFYDVGIDLIAGLPEVSKAEWSRTIETALSLKLKHISVYSLILEEGAKLTGDIKSGLLKLPSTDEVMDTLLETEDILSGAGFERYEISNYGQQGFFCRHNMNVWHGEDYLGLGPAASSRTGITRRTNARDLNGYMKALDANTLPPSDEETLLPEDDAVERFIFALRLNEGVSPEAFVSHYPVAQSFAAKWSKTLASLVKNGITEQISENRWRLTRRGREVADSVAELLEI